MSQSAQKGLCPDCGHIHTPHGCTGEPTPSDLWAGVSVDGCDCIPIEDLTSCYVPRCDGTRLGHDLAVDFPEETKRFDEAIWRITHPEDVANPFRDRSADA